jgi:uncharacterized protein (DUF305 family)
MRQPRRCRSAASNKEDATVSKTLLRFAAPMALSVALAALPSFAQQSRGMEDHSQGAMQHSMPDTPASQAYMQSMDKMNQSMMSQPMTGDADYDFATMMRAHHQAAVDMAKAEIQYGKDPELTKMARKMVEDQSKEIKQLTEWLERHPPRRAQP